MQFSSAMNLPAHTSNLQSSMKAKQCSSSPQLQPTKTHESLRYSNPGRVQRVRTECARPYAQKKLKVITEKQKPDNFANGWADSSVQIGRDWLVPIQLDLWREDPKTNHSDLIVLGARMLLAVALLAVGSRARPPPIPAAFHDLPLAYISPSSLNGDSSSSSHLDISKEYDAIVRKYSNDITESIVENLSNFHFSDPERNESLEAKLEEEEEEEQGLSALKPARAPVSLEESIRMSRVVVPTLVDPVHQKTLEALQNLNVIERDLYPGGVCTRREFSRWLVYASTLLNKTARERVFPAMFVEGSSELAFDDVIPDDVDFPFIQGLAEAGIIPSRLSRADIGCRRDETLKPGCSLASSDNHFHPDSPLSRQDLVSWKMALDMKKLPVVTPDTVQRLSGFMDVSRIDRDALPAVAYDLSTGQDESIILTAFGYTKRFEPKKPVTHAQAAFALAFGNFAEIVGDEVERIEAQLGRRQGEGAAPTVDAGEVQRQLAEEVAAREGVERQLEEAEEEVRAARQKWEEQERRMEEMTASVEAEKQSLVQLQQRVEEELAAMAQERHELESEKQRLVGFSSQLEAEREAVEGMKVQTEMERQSLAIARTWAEEEANRSREEVRQLRTMKKQLKAEKQRAAENEEKSKAMFRKPFQKQSSGSSATQPADVSSQPVSDGNSSLAAKDEARSDSSSSKNIIQADGAEYGGAEVEETGVLGRAASFCAIGARRVENAVRNGTKQAASAFRFK